MNTEERLKKRINDLIDLADRVYSTLKTSTGSFGTNSVDIEIFNEFKNASLSFILSVFGKDHPYYENFTNSVNRNTPWETKSGRGILSSIKTEIDEGWLISLKGILSAEIFTDFIEMAEHLLSENYKDPAAVMIGSVLEEHLKQLSIKNGIPTTTEKNGKDVPKKTDLLNSELVKVHVYNKLDQKNVTAWLDLRNKAAHGHYTEYSKE
jgi:hypothetical protein